jgi:hypothetical protein
MRGDANETAFAELIKLMLTLTYGFGMAFFLVYFFGGMYYFYRARRLLSHILSLDVFDNNNYTKGYLYKNSWIIYTVECFYGIINEYPTIVDISQSFTRGVPATIEFEVCIIKFNRTTYERISFPLNWRGSRLETSNNS